MIASRIVRFFIGWMFFAGPVGTVLFVVDYFYPLGSRLWITCSLIVHILGFGNGFLLARQPVQNFTDELAESEKRYRVVN